VGDLRGGDFNTEFTEGEERRGGECWVLSVEGEGASIFRGADKKAFFNALVSIPH
jgi:hypothetical protein